MEGMLQKLDEVARRFAALRDEQTLPEVLGNRKRMLEIARKLSELEPVVTAYQEYRRLLDERGGRPRAARQRA